MRCDGGWYDVKNYSHRQWFWLGFHQCLFSRMPIFDKMAVSTVRRVHRQKFISSQNSHRQRRQTHQAYHWKLPLMLGQRLACSVKWRWFWGGNAPDWPLNRQIKIILVALNIPKGKRRTPRHGLIPQAKGDSCERRITLHGHYQEAFCRLIGGVSWWSP